MGHSALLRAGLWQCGKGFSLIDYPLSAAQPWSHCGIKLLIPEQARIIIVPGSVSSIPGCGDMPYQVFENLLPDA